jgi:heme-degrading monooxygenase HmoA
VIVRSWRTQVDPERIAEYEQFAQTISLPMFRQQEGCLGVFFFHLQNMCEVLTLWDNMASVEKLARSRTYGETVERLNATGMLWGKQSLLYYESHGGFIDIPRLSEILET